MYAKINRCLLICPFYGGCPHFGESVKRGSTVLALQFSGVSVAFTPLGVAHVAVARVTPDDPHVLRPEPSYSVRRRSIYTLFLRGTKR